MMNDKNITRETNHENILSLLEAITFLFEFNFLVLEFEKNGDDIRMSECVFRVFHTFSFCRHSATTMRVCMRTMAYL